LLHKKTRKEPQSSRQQAADKRGLSLGYGWWAGRTRRDWQGKRTPKTQAQTPCLGHPPFIKGEFSTGAADFYLR